MNWSTQTTVNEGIIIRAISSLVVEIQIIILISLVNLITMFPIYYLWNWLMPIVFKLQVLTIWQSWGLGVLTGLLLKNFSWRKK